jgi:serine phosphatase RsbU (regulator of sigma subunit)
MKRNAQWLFFCLVIFGIPAILCLFAFQTITQKRIQIRSARVETMLEEALARVERESDTSRSFEILLRKAVKWIYDVKPPEKVLAEGWSASDVQKMLARAAAVKNGLQRQYPGVIEFTTVDSEGNLLPALSDGSPPRRAIGKLVEDIKNYGNYPTRVPPNLKMYRFFLGPQLIPEYFLCDVILNVGYQRKHTFAFIPDPRTPLEKYKRFPPFFLIIHLNQTETWDELRMRRAVNRLNQKSKGLYLDLISIANPFSLANPSWKSDVRHLPQIFREFEKKPKSILYRDKAWWGFRVVSPVYRVLARYSDNDPGFGVNSFRNAFLGFLVGFLLFAVFSRRYLTGTGNTIISIRVKLIGLFLYASGVPLLIIGMSAQTYLAEWEQFATHKSHQEVEHTLELFDSQFPRERGRFETGMKRILDAPILPAQSLQEAAIERVYRIWHLFSPGTMDLVDGQAVSLLPPRKASNEGGRLDVGNLRPVIKKLYRFYNGESGDSDDLVQNAATDVAANAMGFSVDAILGLFVRNTGKIITMSLGKGKGTSFIYPIRDQEGKTHFIVTFGWDNEELIRSYLQHNLAVVQSTLPGSSIVGWPIDTYIPTEGKIDLWRAFPSKFGMSRPVRTFLNSLIAQPRFARRKIRRGDGNLILTAVPCRTMEGYILLARTSDLKIRRTIAETRKKFYLFCSLIIFLSVFMGFLLAKQFLDPIRELSQGLVAMQEKEFAYRIPVLSHDELGELSNAFNSVMESLEEVSIGRLVQEELLPAESFEFGEYILYGRTYTATQMGGDYFDYFRYENQIFTVLGDATGHGVPAAMVVAMAKATFYGYCSRGYPIEEFLQAFNHLLRLHIKKTKRFMTLAAVCIDTVTHQMSYFNFGHPFPFHVKTDGIMTSVENIGSPVGVRTKAILSPKIVNLEPGERLIFFTDGLFENQFNCLPDDDGFLLFQNYLLSRPENTSPMESCKDWLANHPAILSGDPLPDDMTILILQRKV